MPKYISDRKRKLDLGINSYTEGSDVLSVTGTTRLSGIITAITGVAVTYYGDGSNLTGIDLGVGINTAGGNVGYGITLLDFRGAGVSTITAPVSGISTVNITGGSGSISISTTAPVSPSAGDLWYSPDRARTFIYYDESEVGYGTSKQWIDTSPFNVGILTATSLTVNSLSISTGLDVSGVITATSFVGDITGNADTATTLETARNFSASGDATASSVSFNGSGDVDLALTLANSGVTAATYGSSSAIPSITVDAKGRITSATTSSIDSTSVSNGTASVSVASNGPITSTGNHDFTDGIDVTGNITVTGTVDGRDVATDGSKLDGIESGATADQTASEILTAIKTVDGASSGLDADVLDGQEGTHYLDYNNFTNTPTIPTNNNQLTNGAGYITSADGGNAATLDSLDSTQFLRSDASDTASGAITLSVDTADALNFSANSTDDARGISFNNRTALSADYNDGWLRLNQSSEFSNGVYTPGNFRADGRIYVDNGTNYLSYPTGNYGSVQINAGGAGSYEGFSIDGRVVFMHDGSTNAGIYNDVNNHWMFYGILGGSAYMYDNGSWKIRTTSSGIQVSGDVNSTSDIKLKKNIETIDNALDKVLRLRGVYFDWKEEVMGTDKNIGLIAQEVEKVVPELVTETERENGDNTDTDEEVISTETIKSVSYGNITAVLIEAIKEQQSQIEELKQEIKELKGKS